MMRKLQLMTLALVLLLGTTPLSAQLFGPKFKAYVLTPPEKRLQGVQKIAVLSFSNLSSYRDKDAGADLGTKLADYMTAELIKEYRGANKDQIYIKGARTNVYDIVERSRLDEVLKEQNLEVSGAIDDNQAVEVGRILGIDAMVVGSLSYEYKDEKSTSTYTDKKTGKTTVTYYIKRTLNAEVRMKIISVSTAQVLGTLNPRTVKIDSKSSTKGYPVSSALMSGSQLADNAYRELAQGLVNYFCPHFSYMNYAIEKIKLKKYKDRAKDAAEYLEKGEIDKAYALYYAIFEEDNYNPKVLYNIGILHEAVGNFEEAAEYLGNAYQMDEDEKSYFKAFKRAEKNLEMAADLKNLGIEIQKFDFQEGGSDVLSKKLYTRGSQSKRVNAYESPNLDSKVVAAIPGGLKLNLLEKSGDWYKVKLMGGKEGFINADDVKEE